MEYYAVKSIDGSYLEQGCKSFTFDRTEMQLFLDERSAENETLKSGYKVDDEQIFVVAMDEIQLIEYIAENSTILGYASNENEGISIIKKVVPNPHVPNQWYNGVINSNKIEVMINNKGFYHIRKLVNTVLCLPDGTKQQNGKHHVYYRINKRGKLVNQ